MQIVIDIDEDTYKDIKRGKIYTSVRDVPQEAVAAIKNGTPLPKGHGRLIDADELKKHKYHDNNRFENAVAVAQIDWADTIIEADKAESEETEIIKCHGKQIVVPKGTFEKILNEEEAKDEGR